MKYLMTVRHDSLTIQKVHEYIFEAPPPIQNVYEYIFEAKFMYVVMKIMV
jgi:hypothetical protein